MTSPGRRAIFLLVSAFMTFATIAGAGAVTAAPASRDTYAAYSLIDQGSTGTFVSPDGGTSQWSWRTEQPGKYSISWDPSKPAYREQFIRSSDGNWLFLDGWFDNGTYYTQRVIEESIGDAKCNNMKPIPSDSKRQHYVKWHIPNEGYCLHVKGTITEGSGGKKFDFQHRQTWSPPASCSNAYFTGKTCITQHEIWWDNNGRPLQPVQKTLDREQYIAKGLGMAFKIRQTHPKPWSADLRGK